MAKSPSRIRGPSRLQTGTSFRASSRGLASIHRRFSPVACEREIRDLLDEALASKLMVEMEDQYLSLAVITNRPRKDKIEENVYTEIQKTPAPLPLLHLV